MRFLRISTYYPAYSSDLYKRRPELRTAGYAEQLSAILGDRFAQSDAYSQALAPIGYECREVVANIPFLQRAWATENDLAWDRHDFVGRLPLEHAWRFQPDVVFLSTFGTLKGDWIRELKAECPSVRLVLGWCASPVSSIEDVDGYDIVLTSSPVLVQRFRREGLRSELLRHAFDTRVLDRLGGHTEKSVGLSFVGSIVRRHGYHELRAELIELLISRLDMAVFCAADSAGPMRVLARRVAYDSAQALKALGARDGFIRRLPGLGKALSLQARPRFRWEDPILSKSKGEVYGLAMYEVLARSQVTLNVHIDMAEGFTGNIRLFEATGVGTCLLTDWKRDLRALFEPDVEVVAYKSPDECLEKARWLLDRPEKCQEIGRAGQRRTLGDHTYAERAEKLDRVIKKALAGS